MEDFADLLEEEGEVVCLVKCLISEMAVWLLGYKKLKNLTRLVFIGPHRLTSKMSIHLTRVLFLLPF